MPPINENATCYFYSNPTEIDKWRSLGQTGVITKKPANYEGVLWTAPEVHGRYRGRFKGVIVANFALFALNEFGFVSDPRFESADILPKLKRNLVTLTP